MSWVSRAQPATLLTRELTFEHLPHELGLSQRTINGMIQDHQGYLWIATWSGLLRYDGYEMELFNANSSDENALKSNKITALFEASDSTIWVGTMVGGLYQLDVKNLFFKQYFHSEDPTSISDNNIWDIIEDDEANLWIATQNGLNRLNRAAQTFDHWYADPDDPRSLTFNFLTGLELSGNALWITSEKGVNRLDLSDVQAGFSRFIYESADQNALDNYAYAVTSLQWNGKELTFWATKKGLKVFDGKTIKSYEVDGRSSSFSFFRSLLAVEGETPFLILGSEKGVSLFDIASMQFTNFFGDYNKEVNLSQNTITSLFIDDGGVLWVGTKKGINKYDTYNNNFVLFETKSFDPTNSIITGIVSDAEGTPWVCTLGGGLFRMVTDQDGNPKMLNHQIVDPENADLTNFIQKLEVDHKGQFWAGTAGAGVYVFNPLEIANQAIVNYRKFGSTGRGGISDNYIMSMEPTPEGDMWIGTWSQGLNKITAEGKVYRYGNSWLEQSPIVTIYQEAPDVLWLGTRGKGLVRIAWNGQEIDSFQQFQSTADSTSLSNDFVNTIYQDSKSRIWIGTEDGLNLYDRNSKRFRRFKRSNGLTNAEIVSILEDKKGLLWLAHFNGISLCAFHENQLNLINDYDVQDHVQGGFFYNEVAMKSLDDKLFFGGSNGFNIVGKDEVYKNPSPPKVVIQNLLVFNQPVGVGEALNGRVLLNQPMEQTKEIVLAHDENSISFEFKALHFAIPEKNKYAHILEGFEENWLYTDATRRIATYTNLKEGQYQFRVKASNDDGFWSENPAEIRIVILPPWWRTKTAWVAYFVSGVLLLLLFRKLTLIRIQYENEIKIERIKRENNEQLNTSRLQFFTNISHEFRTPLSLILGPLENLINSGEGGNMVQQQLKVVTRSANRLQRLINQLLDFRKADAGNLKLQVAEGNFYKFVKEIKLSFDSLAADKKVDFTLDSSSNVIKLFFDRDQMEKVIYNLLSNAFKHVEEQGSVQIKLFEHAGYVELAVSDDGPGISPDEIDHIFDRFFTGEGETGHSSGIGLAFCKSLIQLHRGKIRATSTPGVSTQFTIQIPRGMDHFSKEEILSDFRDSDDITKYIATSPDLSLLPARQDQTYDQRLEDMKRVLIVEDNEALRSFIKSIFQYEYVILEAENGAAGWEVALEENPDIIISDVMMPIMDGFTLCTKIKNDLSTSHIPIVLLTARTSYIYQVEGLEKGADDYITKPFSPEILKLKIKNLLDSRAQFRTLAQSSGNLVIEPKKITVTSADELFMSQALDLVESNMSNSEYSVVEFGKDIGLSRMQLYRKLKALTGLSPNEFIRMMRVKRAAQLFEQGDFNVSEVTYQVGFSDPTYFRKWFKEQFGVTPSEYAKSVKK